jgi:predicted transcriptional regulator
MPAPRLTGGITQQAINGPDEASTNVLHFPPGYVLCLEAPVTTTTIRIDDDLKARVATAAERVGKTSHAFIVDAIAQATEDAERAGEFHRVAGERWTRFLKTGQAIPWDEGRAYLEARARGEKPARPRPRKLR